MVNLLKKYQNQEYTRKRKKKLNKKRKYRQIKIKAYKKNLKKFYKVRYIISGHYIHFINK